MSHSFGIPTLEGVDRPDFVPRLDCIECEKSFEIAVELAGVDRKDVEISVEEDNRLVVKGEKKIDKKNEGDENHFSERYYGVFRRELTLPSTADVSGIRASYKDGVLKISLPKKEETLPQSRKIAIE